MITLYAKNTNEKLAYLNDIIVADSVSITRQINGEFTLVFELLEADLKSTYFESEAYVEVNGHYFDVAYMEKIHTSQLSYSIQCEHVSYRLIGEAVEFYTYDGTPTEILADILTATEFTAGQVDSVDTITFAVYEETNKLGLVQKLAALLGAEIDFDGFSISLKNTIGQDRGFVARFGKNLTGIRKIIDRRNQLTYYALDLVELKTHLHFKDFAAFETVAEGDTIRIVDEVMGIDTVNQVIKRTYNPIRSINTSLEIANSIELLTDTVTKIQRDTVAKDKTYHGIRISPDVGFEAIRSDKKARAFFNSTNMAFQAGDGSGANWANKLYYDYDPDTGETVLVFDGKLSADIIEALDAQFDVTVSNTIVTEALYAENGDIARLTVDQVETSDKVDRYLTGNTADLYFKRIYDQYDDYITASVKFDDAGLPLEEQLLTRQSEPVYWTDDTFSVTTLTETNYPVMVYQYDEVIKMRLFFDFDFETGAATPKIQFGQGDGVSPNSGKGFIFKDTIGMRYQYYKQGTSDLLEFGMTDSGFYFYPWLDGMNLESLDIYDNGFIVKWKGVDLKTYLTTFDANGYISRITEVDTGAETPITVHPGDLP